jgi:hypothetical protein
MMQTFQTYTWNYPLMPYTTYQQNINDQIYAGDVLDYTELSTI